MATGSARSRSISRSRSLGIRLDRTHQLPKLDVYGDQLFVVARPAYLADGQICYGGTSVFLGDTFIISVLHGSERAHSG
jgi:magnesium transporter